MNRRPAAYRPTRLPLYYAAHMLSVCVNSSVDVRCVVDDVVDSSLLVVSVICSGSIVSDLVTLVFSIVDPTFDVPCAVDSCT